MSEAHVLTLLSPSTHPTPGIGGAICAIAESIVTVSTSHVALLNGLVAGLSVDGGGEVIVVAETSVSVSVVTTGTELPSSAVPHPVMATAAIDAAIAVVQIRVEKVEFAKVFIKQILSLPTHYHRRKGRPNS
ncbi:hypothetical protein [Gordonia rubripertincta]|uniref:Uncharacterized protein n=1 Tax=Gordonia rubripertincta TaxID=36822 RepID=A0ABT4N2Z4_GORRU|nr:hypothetical protein [Gordonia rubripertincta]MCZ4552686.1 hypothetical protein [Gordonia rubripertincta]